MTATKLALDVSAWGHPPERDITGADGERITLGDTGVEVLVTPGHTMGTLSLLFPVRDGGREHRALLCGGTGFNFGAQPKRMHRIESYVRSTERVRDIASQKGFDVFISNHSDYDEAISKFAAKPTAASNLFIIGTVHALTTHERVRATMEAWKAS